MRVLKSCAALLPAAYLFASLPCDATCQAAPSTVTSQRIPIVVLPFTDGTPRLRTWTPPRESRFEPDPDLSEVGAGVAEQLIKRLTESGVFRVVDRQALDAARQAPANVSGAETPADGNTVAPPSVRFIVKGTVTECWSTQNSIGAAGARLMTFGLLGINRRKSKMKVNARIVDAATGVVVASLEGIGESTRGGGITIAGIGRGGFASARSDNRATAQGIAEAGDRAVMNLAEMILAKQGNLIAGNY